jgi:maleylacetate reductase
LTVPGYALPPDWGQAVVFGLNRIHELGTELARLGARRAVVLCSWRRRRSDDFAHLGGGLGMTPPVYEGVQPHVPSGLVKEARGAVEEAGGDAVVSFGGGSTVDLGKAVVDMAREEGQALFHVAVPTTYSGAEATGWFWVSEGHRKRRSERPGLRPDLVVLDPALTLRVPWKPTGSTGLTALAHCWEALTDPAGAETPERAAREVIRTLPKVAAQPAAVMARSDLQRASYVAGVVHDSTGPGLHDLLCQGLGARAGVPHGLANAILLPHSMRAAGWEGDSGVGGSDSIEALVRDLGLPRRLREVGVFEQDLDLIAEWAGTEAAGAGGRWGSGDGAAGVLRDAW